jgi:uncharacterized protein DUF4272
MMSTMSVEDDDSPNPPQPARVAARALVLSAVSCRALIENDAHEPGAEVLRQNVLEWLNDIGVAGELEPVETTLLSTPLGKLDSRVKLDATWQSEGMVVLAWALRFANLPPFNVQCEPTEIANAMGFLSDPGKTPLHNPRLREMEEIETWADTYLTLHWRLREFSQEHGAMDFVSYVSACNWGPLRLDHVDILDRDLAIDGVRLDKLEYPAFRNALSITQERHRALNWLLGLETVYSKVTTDT